MTASAVFPRARLAFRRFRRPSGRVFYFLLYMYALLSFIAQDIVWPSAFRLLLLGMLCVSFVLTHGEYRHAKADEEDGAAWPPPSRREWAWVIFLAVSASISWLPLVLRAAGVEA